MRPQIGARALVAIGIVWSSLMAGYTAHAQFSSPPIVHPSIALIRLEDTVRSEIERQIEGKVEAALEERAALGSLDGEWEGTLEVVAATPSTPQRFWHVGDRPELQILISAGRAEVRVKTTDWIPVRVGGGFQALDLGGGGFVYAIHSASGWVENWNLSVTKKDADTLLVFLSFVAGGSLEQLDAVTTEFAVGAIGELKRVAPSAEPGPAPANAGPAVVNGTAFAGVWEGTLDIVSRYGAHEAFVLLGTATNTPARLTLRGEEAELVLSNQPITPGGDFRVAKHDAAALVYATPPLGTWQWSLTKLDADTALVFAWRVGASSSLGDGFALGFLGELERVPSGARRNDR